MEKLNGCTSLTIDNITAWKDGEQTKFKCSHQEIGCCKECIDVEGEFALKAKIAIIAGKLNGSLKV